MLALLFWWGVLRLLECFEIFLNVWVKERIKDKRGKEKGETFFEKNREKKRRNLASRHNFLYVLVQYILLRTKLLLIGQINFERAVIIVKKKKNKFRNFLWSINLFGCFSFHQDYNGKEFDFKSNSTKLRNNLSSRL